jgi:hypothetical protein
VVLEVVPGLSEGAPPLSPSPPPLDDWEDGDPALGAEVVGDGDWNPPRE